MSIMKRNLKSLFKYVIIIITTVIITVCFFNLVRNKQFPINVDIKDELGRYKRLPDALPLVEKSLKVDWHNYTLIDEESRRIGNGEHGKPATFPPVYSKDEKSRLFKTNGFNAYLSDFIALNRSVPDIRHPGCKNMKYLSLLPSVSVIVPFHNEHLSTLLRTVYSVIIRSPPSLLTEIILVDDFSSKPECKKPLDDHIKQYLKKVKVVRLEERKGLIRARLAGAKVATAPVLVFLDSHTEANINWLPPLIEPIAEDEKTCVCPFIDVIAYEDFTYRSQDEGARGSFDWELFYKRLPLLPEDLQNPTKPFKSPVMAGGLFAISAKFFWDLGGYDPGLDIWGGEQYELSFKIWQCGGQLLDAPCSRVGHIYRKFAPFPNPGIGDFVGRNYRRVAEVWMDEYAEYIYKRRPHYKAIDPGDLSAQKMIRKTLKCKPFKWFMEKIAFDLVKKYPPIEPPDFGHGEIRNAVATELCIDTQHKGSEERFGLKPCVKDERGRSGEQDFQLTWHKDIRPKGRSLCWDVSKQGDKAPVVLYSCHGGQGNQLWKYDVDKKWLIHGGNPRCLDADLGRRILYVTTCDIHSETQRWHLENVNYKALANWQNI